MPAKRFFYVCAGLLCLALSYHLGARSAVAQAGSSVTGITMANVRLRGGTVRVHVERRRLQAALYLWGPHGFNDADW